MRRRPERRQTDLTDKLNGRKALQSSHKLTVIRLLAALCGVFFLIPAALAQTSRVSCGRTPDGVNTYIEVYEYDYVHEKPSFPGGDERLVAFINETRRYPAEAYRKGVQGRVTCSFVVNTDGSVSNIQLLRGVEKTLNEEALRIFRRMPRWTPGRIDDVAVPVRVVRSVHFRK